MLNNPSSMLKSYFSIMFSCVALCSKDIDRVIQLSLFQYPTSPPYSENKKPGTIFNTKLFAMEFILALCLNLRTRVYKFLDHKKTKQLPTETNSNLAAI